MNLTNFNLILPYEIKLVLTEFLNDNFLINNESCPNKISVQNDLLFLPVNICKQFNSKLLIEELYENSKIIQYYFKNIEKTKEGWLPAGIGLYLKENSIFYLLIIFLSTSFEELEDWIKLSVPKNEDCQKTIIKISPELQYSDIKPITCEFLIKFKQKLFKEYQDKQIKPKIFLEILRFYSLLKGKIIQNLKQKEILYLKNLGPPPPSYLPLTIKKRLLFLSFLPNYKEYIFILKNAHTPNLNLLNTDNIPNLNQRKIDFDTFKELLKYIPKSIPKSDSQVDFNDYIWDIHVSIPAKMNQKVIVNKYKCKNYHSDVLFWQMLCFQLPNWQELWFKMRWNTSIEIIKRLIYLKENEFWKPNIKDIIYIFFF